MDTTKPINIESRDRLWLGRFDCMASSCEILIEISDKKEVQRLIRIGVDEARRIEEKFSRYRDDNLVHAINSGGGEAVAIDAETFRLLTFADQCFELSDGLFDITAGVLRKCWSFAPDSTLPDPGDVEAVLGRIGWKRVRFDKNEIELPTGMEIDFGGIGKEYAVDRVLQLLEGESDAAILINFGGDCHANRPQAGDKAWLTGIENPSKPGDPAGVIQLKRGALATSGDAYRFIEQEGVRYGHILDPHTGWPTPDAPRSVTVAAPSCTEAGILSTLAMLQGSDAEVFLDRQDVKYWCYR